MRAKAKVITIQRARRKRYSHTRNARVRRVTQNEWSINRLAKFKSALKFAAAAKSFRTALGVTQTEVGRHYRVTNASVARWESGAYFGWNAEDLKYFCRAVSTIAGHKEE